MPVAPRNLFRGARAYPRRAARAAVSEYIYVLDLGWVRAAGDRASFGDDTQLRDTIAEWLDYQVD